MIIVKNDLELKLLLQNLRSNGHTVGFVPTMGALHQGHIALLTAAKSAYDLSVVSIFINPTQFNNLEDLKKYPVSTSSDIDLLELNGCDVVYLPSRETIYPNEAVISTDFKIGHLEHILEGKFRPGHYHGVVQVVNILLKTVQPDALFLGAKDYQQCAVLTKFAAEKFKDLVVTKIETERAKSGLALSSRNARLSKSELLKAPAIYKSLVEIKNRLTPGDVSEFIAHAKQSMIASGLDPEYLVIADALTLEELKIWDGRTKIVALVAAQLGSVRLIDNLELN